MKYNYWIILIVLIPFFNVTGQSTFDDVFPMEKMEKDLSLFIKVRKAANSGLYKYKSEFEIDSLHKNAFSQLSQLRTYRDFYNLIRKITAFEGSCHNQTGMDDNIYEKLKAEESGYFPFPIQVLGESIRINFKNSEIPLGAEIISINDMPIGKILKDISIYANTDGNNMKGKSVYFNASFSTYFRYRYGKQGSFKIEYKTVANKELKTITLNGVGNADYYTNRDNRYFGKQKEVDEDNDKTKYSFKLINNEIGALSIHDFGIDDTDKYQSFLDSCLNVLNSNKIDHLILDVRRNGGGSKPHDMLTLQCFTSKSHKEVKSAWTSMNKIPYWRYFILDVPYILRPIARIKINKELRKAVPLEKDGRYYYEDIVEYEPHKNAYKGKVYLLIGPNVASATSLFASMMMSHTNTISIGEETTGGYYGHNGVFPIVYELPKSNIKTVFSIANIEQDVIAKENQSVHNGIIPDIIVEQSEEDFLKNEDTQFKFIISKLIKKTDHNN